MSLPLEPPLAPMLAKLASRLPEEAGWLYEPKWDGFRVLVFRDGPELYLQSRDKKPLLRYFPELAQPLLEALPNRCVVDGELVITAHDPVTLDFERLQLRLHPAASRIQKLSVETPAKVVLWDLLALDDADLTATPLSQRRAGLEDQLRPNASVLLSPATTDLAVARDWFERFEGAGLDGVMAKPLTSVYTPGSRKELRKIKHQRTADCVLAGFRWHKHGPGTRVGSFVLALWGDQRLHQIGVCASFSQKRQTAFAELLEPLREDALEGHPWASWAEVAERRPGMGSRWSAGKDLSWEPVRLERVVEVSYNQMTGGRLRHPAKFVRWRPDREVASCTFEQLTITPPRELNDLFTA